MIKKILLTSAFALVFAPLAHADVIDTAVYNLNISKDLGNAQAGTVTLTYDESDPGVVTVDVLLNSNYSFRSNSDSQHTGFGFNLTGITGPVTVTPSTGGFTYDGSAGYAGTPYGNFEYALDCTSTTLCSNGPTATKDYQGELKFTISATGLTLSSFAPSSSSNGSSFFEADLQKIGGSTGTVVAQSDPTITTTGTTPVPEPSSLALLGTGLAGMAEMIRRRMR